MSQEKVERYKKEKVNRKQIIKQQKRKALATKMAVGIIMVAAVGWIGYSAYNMAESNKPETVVDVNLDSINAYLSEVSADVAQ